MSSRILAMALATTIAVFSVLGCGNDTPKFDPAVQYTPETLASEFVFQYKSMKSKTGGAATGEDSGPKERSGIATKASKPATKEFQVGTLTDLLADVITKAGSIPGLSQAQACKKVAEVIGKDPAVSDSDKKTISEKLGQVTD